MTTQAAAAPLADDRADRYRQAERALWDHYGLDPIERYVEIDSPTAQLRVVEVGSGEPVLFIPGTPGTGPHPLARRARLVGGLAGQFLEASK